VKDHLLFNIYVQGERKHPYQARTVFLDNQVDPGTSTVLVRCELPNPDESVLPGDYVFAQAQVGEYHDKIVVPERAVMEGQAGASVYLVDSKGQIAVASVKELDTYEGLRVIDSGLAAGDKVVVEGIQLVRPGMEVQAEETTVKLPAPAEAADRPAPAAVSQPPAKPTPPPKPQ
jgi:RND family efflux transporter MFP subunit